MRRIISAIALWLPVTLLAGGTLTFPFSAEEAGSWKRTGGTDCNVESGVLIVDGTHWDSKVYRTVELFPGASYELSVVGRGKTVVKLMENWQKNLVQLPISGTGFHAASVSFRTPAASGKLILCVQVNAEKGRAEVKRLAITPVSEQEPEVKSPADSTSGVVWRESFSTAAAAEKLGAEFLAGGGPDGMNCVKFSGTTGELQLDTNLLRGRIVTVEAMIRGEELGGGTLMISPAAPAGPGEYYPALRADKGSFDWRKFGYSVRIPDYAGKLKLRFLHAGKGGNAYYADVKLSLSPLPAPFTCRSDAPLQKVPKYRGAMIGSLRGEEEASIREFGEVWHGNLVRYQFSGGGRENTPEKYAAWGERQMEALDRKLPLFEKYGIKVIIDLHSGPEAVNEIQQNVGVWNQESQEMIVALWRNIARRYRGNPNIYGYDILNEPLEPAYVYREGGALDWNRFAERIALAIREIDPDTPVIIPCSVGGNPVGFAGLRPVNIPNAVYTVHFYLPHNYTHQGVNGAPMIGAYPGVNSDGMVWNKELLRRALEPVVRFQKQYNVPILVGEFGVARWAPGGEQYLVDLIDLFEEYGWDWAYHAYREWNGWSAEHSADPADLNRQPNTLRKTLLIGYFSRNKR
ncbi:cellulase family glycosylhydrolase [uncultured Victivallis sp.]|uniref:glycoside hydrolase family 5 protein n=1 Tax=uncultured Victivallis sp. TaxID=354118 RepID=UPI0025FCC30F|nr:cellulase family glycosylhydrolase [uncultured Victivallis sp.]